MTAIRWIAAIATVLVLAGASGPEAAAALPPPDGVAASVAGPARHADIAAPEAPVRLAQSGGERNPTLRRGKLAPVSRAEKPGALERARLWILGAMAALGAETGIIGAICLAVAGLAGLLGLWRLWRLVASRWFETRVPGEVVASHPAPGGGYHPVIRYVDRAGKGRQFTAPLVTPGDPVGLMLRLRIDGPRPRIVGSPPSPVAEAAGLLLPLLVAFLAGSVALTGRLAGLPQLALL